MPDAKIIPFPDRRMKTCSDCDWAAFGVYGTYCTNFHEEITNEAVAEECSEYKN